MIDVSSQTRSTRPVKDTLAICLPSGHFYIHYDTTGNSAPDLTDLNVNGIPDYVDEVCMIADSSHHVLVDILGYNEEPFDGEGGYDIYIMSYAAGMYGFNYHESAGTSYMRIDNDYTGYDSHFDLSPIKIMQITVGHEYFHGIQWGYRFALSGNAYFYEMTSMWFEDILIPDGNDYIDPGYLSDPNDGWAEVLLDNPAASFDNTGNGYELALFGHYLSSFLDPSGSIDIRNTTIIREMWERFGSSNSNAFSAVKYVLDGENYSLTFIEAWVDFITRNLYNGYYNSMENPYYYYIDQALINPITTTINSHSSEEEFQLGIDNKSIAIKSFSLDDIGSVISINHSDINYVGRLAQVGSVDNDFKLFWSSDTSFINVDNNLHFVYARDSQSSAEETLDISVKKCQLYVYDVTSDCEYDVNDIVALVNCVLAANCAAFDNDLGDLNYDGLWNIFDIIGLANCILASNCNT